MVCCLLVAAVGCRSQAGAGVIAPGGAELTSAPARPGETVWFGATNFSVTSDVAVRVVDVELLHPPAGATVRVRGWDGIEAQSGLGALSHSDLAPRERRALIPLTDVVFRPGESRRYEIAVGLSADEPGRYAARAGYRLTIELNGRRQQHTIPSEFVLVVKRNR